MSHFQRKYGEDDRQGKLWYQYQSIGGEITWMWTYLDILCSIKLVWPAGTFLPSSESSGSGILRSVFLDTSVDHYTGHQTPGNTNICYWIISSHWHYSHFTPWHSRQQAAKDYKNNMADYDQLMWSFSPHFPSTHVINWFLILLKTLGLNSNFLGQYWPSCIWLTPSALSRR